jgi:hypothetical protein
MAQNMGGSQQEVSVFSMQELSFSEAARDHPCPAIGAHFPAQANFSARLSFFNAASALSASDLLAKGCAPSTRTGGFERVNLAPLPLL